jgi:integrase
MAARKPDRINIEKGLWKIVRYYDDRPDAVTYQIRYGTGSGGMGSGTYPTATQARTALAKARARAANGEQVDKSRTELVFQKVAKEWIDNHPEWKPNTRRTNQWTVDVKLEPLHGLRMRKITKGELLKFRTELMTTPKANGDLPAPASVRRTMAILYAICEYARITDCLLTNPCADLPRLKSRKKEPVHIPSHDEVERLIAALSRPIEEHQDRKGRTIKKTPADPRWAAAVATSAYAGLRAGEICGLRVGDFDAAARTLIIARSVPTTGNVVSTPKSDAGLRTLADLPRRLCARLAVLAEGKARNDYLFGFYDDKGVSHPFRHMGFYRKHFKPACNERGLDIRFHDLRHWHASILIDMGYSPVDVAYRLGHASATTTLSTYAHLFKKHPTGLGEALDARIAEVLGEKQNVVALRKKAPF